MTAILAATGVHTYYGVSHILRGVDLAVAPGEAVGLMGRNGMGKTTLIRTLLGLVPARAGQVLLDGRDAAGVAPHVRARAGVATVPEGRGVFASLSVRENLALAARPGADGTVRWPMDRVLATFPRLAQRIHHRGGQLSGGEQQMVAIGRALMTSPRLLILDEATSALDSETEQAIQQALAELSSGRTTLVIAHRLATIRGADRIVVVTPAGIAEQGTHGALLAAGGAYRRLHDAQFA